MTDPQSPPPERCRLILIVPPMEDSARLVEAALGGGDVASVIIAREGVGEADYARLCEELVPVIQAHGVAALVCDDSRAMGRSGADGILIHQPGDDFRESVARFSPQKIVGFAGNLNRHRALELGEAGPEFLFFGRATGDIRPEPHPKNLALAEWWSKFVEVPCVVMGGSRLESIIECAASGAEFAALGLAIFANTDGPGAAVRRANDLLDEHASFFEDG